MVGAVSLVIPTMHHYFFNPYFSDWVGVMQVQYIKETENTQEKNCAISKCVFWHGRFVIVTAI
jgi:hypothetical protein